MVFASSSKADISRLFINYFLWELLSEQKIKFLFFVIIFQQYPTYGAKYWPPYPTGFDQATITQVLSIK